ncbi:MAG: hypothetical protein LBP30_04340 [Clostridiales Family XIII bacterium]|jgi:hypothetical protein|nr:hypothetical protein [Clostridiales Family XIII bacterium]
MNRSLTFIEVAEETATRFADSPLGKQTENKSFDKPIEAYDKPLGFIQIVENKRDGIKREEDVGTELKKEYPESENYQIVREAYLRDKNGQIVKDPETGEARRIDFVVVKDGRVIDSVEVTSQTAPKDAQCAKEARIREHGGNFIKLPDGSMAEFSSNTTTKIERRD